MSDINRNFAIRILKLMRGGIKMGLPYTQDPVEKEIEQEQLDALNYAIPFLETEPCEDCISREYIYKRLSAIDHDEDYESDEFGGHQICFHTCDYDEVLREVQEAPSVYPKSDTIPRERIEQMAAEIEFRRTRIIQSRDYKLALDDVMDIIHKYTNEQTDNTRPYYANEWL